MAYALGLLRSQERYQITSYNRTPHKGLRCFERKIHMNEPIKFGSVCSGIEAASVAWMPLGWKAAWLAEIEPFPCAVLAHHYPDVPNLGDMTALPERIAAGEVEAPDVFCGGTPCQAFSVAGLRNSLTDERGGLTLKFVEIANAIDHVRAGRGDDECIIFWENVPGVLNTRDNAFGSFLAGLAGESESLEPPRGKWTNAGAVFGPQRAVAWRVLDAQYFGVAQRRRRVFVVASARKGFDPAAVLFESEGVRRDIAPSREAGEVAPATPARSLGGGGLDTTFGTKQGLEDQHVNAGCPVYGIPGNWIGRQPDNGGNATTPMLDISPCLTSTDRHGVAAPAIAFPANMSGTQHASTEDLAPSMGAANPTAVAVGVTIHGTHPTVQKIASYDEIAQCLRARTPGNMDNSSTTVVMQAVQVRRLTPVESEKLQGFPDSYTMIPWRNKPADQCPDGPRYRALGNSWAVPVVSWIGRRIQHEIAT